MIHFRIRFEAVRDRLAEGRRRGRWLRAGWRGIVALALCMLVDSVLSYTAIEGMPLSGWIVLPIFVVIASVLRDLRNDQQTDPAGWLDRQLGLGELLVTAVEVDRRGPTSGPERWLLDDAASALAEQSAHPALRSREVATETEALVAALLMATGILLTTGWLHAPVPDAWSLGSGPPGRGGPPGAAGPGQGPGVGGLGIDLAPAGDRMGDHAALRDTARAFQAGNAADGARALRQLADHVPELSERGSAEVAEAIREAAERIPQSEAGSALADAMRVAGESLKTPDRAAQAEALDNVASALEEAARSAEASRGQGPTPRAELREGPLAERLRSSGAPVAVPTGRTAQEAAIAAGRSGGAVDSGEAGNAGVARDAQDAGVRDALPPSGRGMDANDRAIVQRYFARRDGRPSATPTASVP